MRRDSHKHTTLDKATKRAMRDAGRRGDAIGWKEARKRGLHWCVDMWPDFYLEGRRREVTP